MALKPSIYTSRLIVVIFFILNMYCIIWNLIKIEIAFFTVKVIKLIQGQKLGIKK